MESPILGQSLIHLYLKAWPFLYIVLGILEFNRVVFGIISNMANFNLYLLALAAYAIPAPSASTISNDLMTRSPQTIEWGPCGDLGFNETVELSCGSLTVPLDYTEPESGETLDLQILKILAPNQPSKGSVFFNFGGPGATGIGEMASAGNLLTA